jgi:hypothetical protein
VTWPVIRSTNVFLVSIRHAIRAVLVSGAAAAGGLLAGSAAYAGTADDGAEPGSGLSALETILIFGGIPVALFLLIALLAVAPSIARGPRYRADRRWSAEPQRFGAAQQAVTHADRAPAPESGGASGRW